MEFLIMKTTKKKITLSRHALKNPQRGRPCRLASAIVSNSIIFFLVAFTLITSISIPAMAMISTENIEKFQISSPQDAARLKGGQPLTNFGKTEVVTVEPIAPADNGEEQERADALKIKLPTGEKMMNYVLVVIIIITVLYLSYAILFPRKKLPKPKHPNIGKGQRLGYTLLELLITIAFVSIAFLAILQLFVGSMSASADVEGTQLGLRLGESKMEQLINTDFNVLTNEAKAVVSGMTGYSQQVSISAISSYEKQITVNTYWKVKGSELVYPLVTIVTNI
jgi:type II secretory pathway pseudopilin PulG